MNDIEAMKYVTAHTGFECVAGTGGPPHLLLKLAANKIEHYKADTWEAAAQKACADILYRIHSGKATPARRGPNRQARRRNRAQAKKAKRA